ncbi:MAG: undecaprenyl/decaprenyl-phosphate alpha-N-acetylglucosaminyl 1-phosphate transferase [Candidatus Marinimicrobia bacterium]|nr:undecaprenyl/decaprenyl-phosphate alpha-N-acetylglucosaminyl 1-phosphate transferase [Candidatus Neomarinimicrobiota bacterium]
MYNEKITLKKYIPTLIFVVVLIFHHNLWEFLSLLKLPYLYHIIIPFTFSAGLIPIFYTIGKELNIVDKPGGRHIHKSITPRTGGIAILISFTSCINLIKNLPREFYGLFVGSAIIGLLGILDDIKRLPATLKLIVQIVAAGIVIYHGIYFTFLPDTLLWKIVETILTIVWILSITNAFNFLDGIDGLASGIGIVSSTFFFIIAYMQGDNFMLIANLIFVGTVLGFFVYNFRYKKRALIFLGDAGSNLIGFIISILAIYGTWGDNKSIDIIIPILILGIPIADLVMTTILRIGERKVRNLQELLSYTGTDHIHHRTMKVGLSPKKAVIALFALNVIMGIISILIHRSGLIEGILAIAAGIMIFVLFIYIIVTGEKNKTHF